MHQECCCLQEHLYRMQPWSSQVGGDIKDEGGAPSLYVGELEFKERKRRRDSEREGESKLKSMKKRNYAILEEDWCEELSEPQEEAMEHLENYGGGVSTSNTNSMGVGEEQEGMRPASR